MMIDQGSRGLRAVTVGAATQLVDVRCGECPACSSGRDYWCLTARDSGPVRAEVTDVQDADAVRRWVAALAALAAARPVPSAVLLVVADARPGAAEELVAPWHSGPVVAASDTRNREVRRRLAELSPTGRAPLVLTVGDLRAAVRAVERGGQVCGPDGHVQLPTITELVQRDVSLVSARTVDALVAGTTWGAFADRLAAVLTASTEAEVVL